MTIKCEGPHGKKELSELNDYRDGRFTLYIRPQEVGRHSLSIQYGGHHVPGSPFQLRVSSAPDPSKVRVYGPGVEHGVLARYQSRFICDTRGAGAGQLTVRIRGPKGARGPSGWRCRGSPRRTALYCASTSLQSQGITE